MATYVVTQAGAGSGNGSNLANAMSIAAANIYSAMFQPGDTVEFSGAFTTLFAISTVNHAGTSLSPVTYTSYTTAQPTWSLGALGCITIGDKVSGVVINNLSLTSSTPNSSGIGGPIGVIYGHYTTVQTNSNITISNCTIVGGLCGINFTCAATPNVRVNNIGIYGNTISLATEFGIYLQEATGTRTYFHYSGVHIGKQGSGNNIQNITGDSVSTTASGNGIVVACADGSVTQIMLNGQNWGTLIEYNYVYNCAYSATNSSGPAGIYAEGSTFVAYQYNIVGIIYSTNSGVNGDGMSPGTSGPCLMRYNFIFHTQGAGIGLAFDAQSGTDIGPNGQSDISCNIIVDCGGGYIASTGWAFSPTGTKTLLGTGVGGWRGGINHILTSLAAESPNKIVIYNNTVLGPCSAGYDNSGSVNNFNGITAISVQGGAYYVLNNIMESGWISFQFTTTSGFAPAAVVGNYYVGDGASGPGTGARIYNYDSTAVYQTLAAFQALNGTTYTGPGGATNTPYGEIEKISSTTYGIEGYTGISRFISAPSGLGLLPFYSQFVPPVGSSAFGGGVNVATVASITTNSVDLSGNTLSNNIGAITVASPVVSTDPGITNVKNGTTYEINAIPLVGTLSGGGGSGGKGTIFLLEL